jgi:type IX secretion system PorP/SprF family membrane protein
MKNIFIILVFACMAYAGLAQEAAVYSQYQVYPILTNPGYTGFNNQHEFVGNARSSWTGFAGNPNTFTAMYSGPVGDKLALGGGIFSEKIGDMNTFKIQLNYAFRFRIQRAQIGIGLSTEFLNRNISSALLNSPIVNPNDLILENMTDGQKYFDAAVGTHVLYDEKFFVNFSLPNTVSARLDEVPTSEPTEDNGGLFSHYIFHLGYIVNVKGQNFKVIPSLALRNVRDVPYQIDLNVQGWFLDDKLIAGLTFRPSSGGSMVFMLGSRIKQFQVLYSYDVGFSDFQQYNGGSHELGLSFSLKRKSKVQVEEIPGN